MSRAHYPLLKIVYFGCRRKWVQLNRITATVQGLRWISMATWCNECERGIYEPCSVDQKSERAMRQNKIVKSTNNGNAEHFARQTYIQPSKNGVFWSPLFYLPALSACTSSGALHNISRPQLGYLRWTWYFDLGPFACSPPITMFSCMWVASLVCLRIVEHDPY